MRPDEATDLRLEAVHQRLRRVLVAAPCALQARLDRPRHLRKHWAGSSHPRPRERPGLLAVTRARAGRPGLVLCRTAIASPDAGFRRAPQGGYPLAGLRSRVRTLSSASRYSRS